MKFAYADPPYLGCSRKHYGDHPEHGLYDTLEGHRALIERLVSEFPDGWAYSCTSGNLQTILPVCPAGVRVAAWATPPSPQPSDTSHTSIGLISVKRSRLT